MRGDETLGETDELVEPSLGRLPRGAALGRYVVLETLGSGGMGVVYAAYDPELDRRVAVKLLHDDPLGVRGSTGRSRLLREAQALARLSHPNVVAVHDAGTEGDRVFIAMEFIHGQTLRAWTHAAARTVEEIVDVFVAAGRGLAAAHAAGLVHRDFKPENVMIGVDGRVRVMDFGLARSAVESSAQDAASLPPEVLASSGELVERPLTVTGAILGTPAYMSPEQHMGNTVGPATDQFAFCVSLYEALYGERPFEGARPSVVAVNVIAGNVRPPPSGTKVPAALRSIVLRGLRPEPDQRWPSMDALLEALQRRPDERKRKTLVFALGGAGLLGLAYLRTGDTEPSVCSEGEAQIADTWNDTARRKVAAAFEGTGLPLARAILPRVEAALDEQARTWSAAYRSACEDTHVRHVQSERLFDLRMHCLARHREALDALIVGFAQADESTVQNALQSVASLGEIERCADREHLLAAIAPPEDAATAEAVEAIRVELARSAAARELTTSSDALPAVERALEHARATGYAPVIAEATLAVGHEKARLGRNDEARVAILDAWWQAIASGHDALAIEAATAMVNLTAPDFAEASKWARDAWAFTERHDPGDRGRAALLAAESRTHAFADRLDEAERRLRDAVAIYERVAADEPILASMLSRLAEILSDKGRFAEALGELERSREIFVAALGDEHPAVSDLEMQLGTMFYRLGRTDEALERLKRSAEITERAFGPTHPKMGRVLSNIANALSFMTRYEDALAYHERAYAVFSAIYPEDSLEIARALGNWGVTLDFAGRYAESRDKHERALAIAEAHLPPDDRFVASQLGNLGSALQGLGEYERAVELHQRALPIWEARVGPDHPDLGIALRDLSRALIGAGQAERAVPQLERAVEVFSRAEVDPLEVAETRYFLGLALSSQRATRERGRGQIDLSRAAFEEAGERGRARLDALQRWVSDRPEPLTR